MKFKTVLEAFNYYKNMSVQDMEKRAQRIVQVYGEREESPEKRLRDKDKRRAAYYQMYTDMAWGDARHYHVALDSGALGIEKCVSILTGLY